MQLEGITAIMAACGIIAIEAAVFTGLSICAGCILSQRNNNDGKRSGKQEKEKNTMTEPQQKDFEELLEQLEQEEETCESCPTETHQRTGAKDAAHMGTYKILNS